MTAEADTEEIPADWIKAGDDNEIPQEWKKTTAEEHLKTPGYDPVSHAVSNPEEHDTALEAYIQKENRPFGDKLKDVVKTINPFDKEEAYSGAAKGIYDFAGGILRTIPHAASSAVLSYAADKWNDAADEVKQASQMEGKPIPSWITGIGGWLQQQALTSQAETTLGLQRSEESFKGALQVGKRTGEKLGQFAGETLMPPQSEADKRADELSRREMQTRQFNEKVESARNQLKLQHGIPLDTGVVSTLQEGGGGYNPQSNFSPEALQKAGAPPVDIGYTEQQGAAVDPTNFLIPMAPELPGARKIAGAGAMAAGGLMELPNLIGEASLSTKLGRGIAATIGAGAEAGLAHTNPLLAAKAAESCRNRSDDRRDWSAFTNRQRRS